MYAQEDSSKYVANILSNMANGDRSVQVTYAMPAAAYANAIHSGATSTLTPTTLSTIEQTFIELQSVPSTATTVHNPMTQSGFVPPIVNSIAAEPDYYSDSTSSDGDYYPVPKRLRIGDKTTTIMSQHEIENPQRKTHRRQLKDEDVTPEEAARRSMRRERNKVAAAKCRQRRVDHTNRLLIETDKLEKDQSSIESEIQMLQKEKDNLEFILQAHSPLCKVNGVNVKVRPPSVKVTDTSNVMVKEEPEPEIHVSRASLMPQDLRKELSSTSRPSSLPLVKNGIKPEITSAGVSITTPSGGFFSFSLDTMVDHTGLTPLTGNLGHTGLTPILSGPITCSSEVKKLSTSSDSSSDSMKSPSSLISL